MVTQQATLKAAEYTYKYAIDKIFNQLNIQEPENLNITKDSEYFRDQEQIETKEEYLEKFNMIEEKLRELQFQLRYKENEVGLYKDLLE